MTEKLPTRPPLDAFPYQRHANSRPFATDMGPGVYIYVQDENGIVHVLAETEGHLHPKVLGGGTPAAAAGGMKLEAGGVIVELDNYSGTFQFGPEILPQVREALERQGGKVAPAAE